MAGNAGGCHVSLQALPASGGKAKQSHRVIPAEAGIQFVLSPQFIVVYKGQSPHIFPPALRGGIKGGALAYILWLVYRKFDGGRNKFSVLCQTFEITSDGVFDVF